jgi:hypothetical protein
MRQLLCILGAAILTIILSGFCTGQTGAICGNPTVVCQRGKSFQPNDLAFVLPPKLKWQTNYTSSYFYAVILQSKRAVKDDNVDSNNCSKGYFSESERLRVQVLFPGKKVFTSRNGCYGATGNAYTNVNSDYEFIAVFGGLTESEAEAIRSIAKNKGYKDAYLKRMQVMYQYGD